MKNTRANTEHLQGMAKVNVNGVAFLLLSLSDLRISNAPWEPLEQKEFLWVLLRYPVLEEGWHFRRFYTKGLQCLWQLSVCLQQTGGQLPQRKVRESVSLQQLARGSIAHLVPWHAWSHLKLSSPDTLMAPDAWLLQCQTFKWTL